MAELCYIQKFVMFDAFIIGYFFENTKSGAPISVNKKVPASGTSINGSRDNQEPFPLLQQKKQVQILPTLQISSRK